MIIKVKNVRICFCDSLFTPSQVMGQGELKYSSTFLVPKGDAQLMMLHNTMVRVANDKWGTKGPQTLKSLVQDTKVFLRDGDTKVDFDGYEGHMFFNATRPAKTGVPLVIDMDKGTIAETDGTIYAGCYVDVSCEVYAQDNVHGKRINCVLRAVRFLREGEALTGSAPAKEDEFDDLTDVGEGTVTPGIDNQDSFY